MKRKLSHFFLKNGIEVVVYPIKEVRAVTIYVGLNAGSSIEPKSEVGTVHFLEHMIFRGSKEYPSPKDVAIAQERLGISSNAWVSNTDCRFWFLIPDTKLRASFEFIFDTIANPLLTERSVENSQEVILTEQRNHWDNPENNFYKKARDSVLGKGHINNRLGFGDMDVVEKMTREKVVKCYEKYYVPANLKISIAGNMEEKTARDLLEETFGKLNKTGSKLEYPKTNELGTIKTFQIFDQPRRQVAFNILFPYRGFKEDKIEKRLASWVFNYLLGAGYSSLLYERLREELGIVYNISSTISRWPFAGYFDVFGKVNVENLSQAIVETFKILKKPKEDGFENEKVKRTIDYFNIKSLVNFSGTNNISEYFLDDLLFEEKIRVPEDYIEIRNKLTTKDVNSIGKEILDFRRVNLHLMGDKKLIEKSGVKEIFRKV